MHLQNQKLINLNLLTFNYYIVKGLLVIYMLSYSFEVNLTFNQSPLMFAYNSQFNIEFFN